MTHPCPELPEEVLREQAYLVERGVRTMALIGAEDVHRLLRVCGSNVVPFSVDGPAGITWSGVASHAWAVDLLQWAVDAPTVQRDRIVGLLLGYSADAIRHFDELTATLVSHDEEGVMDKFDSGRGCPKCGAPGAQGTYQHHAVAYEGYNCEDGEHIHRTCRLCGYDWSEATLS